MKEQVFKLRSYKTKLLQERINSKLNLVQSFCYHIVEFGIEIAACLIDPSGVNHARYEVNLMRKQ